MPLTAINQFLTVGGEWRHDKLSDAVNLTGGTSSKTSASQYALFVEDEWRIFEPLALTTGVRMDDHETYGEHWSPRAYLVYNATDTVTVKGGWATAKTPGGYTIWNTGAAWQVTKDVKLRAGVLNLGDKDLSRDDYSYNEDGRRYFMAVDYRF